MTARLLYADLRLDDPAQGVLASYRRFGDS